MNYFAAVLTVVILSGASRTASAQLAPKTEPLSDGLVGKLFERIDRKEKVEFELLCQALLGNQTTLRAYAATLLGESGDHRAIPFLIDALSDQSMHVGAHYSDAGDLTTRHRANKSLLKLTKQDFGFVWNDPKENRQTAIQKWVDWYRKTMAVENATSPCRGEPGFVLTRTAWSKRI
jgi:hypothetical protein